MKRSIGAMIGLLLLFLATVGVANAASLNLTSPQMSTASAADKCAETVQVAPGFITAGTTKSVVLSGLDAKCANKKTSITLYSAQGAALATVKEKSLGSITGGEATVTLPKTVNIANAQGAALTIGTWGIPTTFTKPLPLLSCTIDGRPDVACSVAYNSDVYRTGFTLEGVTISTTPVVVGASFTLTINLADPVLPQPIRELRSQLVLASSEIDCDSRPIIDLVAKGWGSTTDKNGKAGSYSIGGSNGPREPGYTTRLNCLP